MSDSEKLTRRQEAGIGFLLSELTQEQAAARTGVSTATLRRWLSNPVFVRAYRAARRQLLEAALGQLQQTCSEAVETLKRNLRCGKPAVEIRAAATILEQAVKGVELTDLVEEVEELKQAFADRGRKS